MMFLCKLGLAAVFLTGGWPLNPNVLKYFFALFYVTAVSSASAWFKDEEGDFDYDIVVVLFVLAAGQIWKYITQQA